MFTGIIEATASVMKKEATGLTVGRPEAFDDVRIGSSIAVSGACLSITKFDQNSLSFDVVAETWARTKLGSLREGDFVNLERAMKASDRFDGHIVQGHVDGVGTVVEAGVLLRLSLPTDLSKFLIRKGSITVDGVSLTIAEKIEDNTCSIALIPHTLEHTTLGRLRSGDLVNIETDVLGRMVWSMLLSAVPPPS